MKIRRDNRSLRKSESNRIIVEKTILKSNVDTMFSLQNLKVGVAIFFKKLFLTLAASARSRNERVSGRRGRVLRGRRGPRGREGSEREGGRSSFL